MMVILISVFAVALAGSSVADPTYLYGDQVTVKVYPTGSYVVNPLDFPSRFYDSSSSFWSFNIDGSVTTTIDVLTIDHVLTPVRKMSDGSIKVQYILKADVLVDVTFREAGTSAEISVTIINIGPNSHTVGIRHLYDLKGKTVTPSGLPPVTNEVEFKDPSFSKVDMFEGGSKAGSAFLDSNYQADPPSKVIFGHYQGTGSSSWSYAVDHTRELADEPAMMVYWEDMSLPSGSYVRRTHYFGKDTPTETFVQDQSRVESISVDPQDAYVGKTRKVWAVVTNRATTTRTIEVDFMVTDDAGKYIANGTVKKSVASGQKSTFEWQYTVKKVAEDRVVAVADPSRDDSPVDNYAVTTIIAKPSPYKIRLVFEDTTRIDYISIDSGKTAKSTFIVENHGTVEDTVSLSTTKLPEKWTVTFNRSGVSLGPGESKTVKVEVKTAKDNKYYNYGIDLIGRSQGGGTTDKVMLFISFSDVIAKGGGDINISGNVTPVNPNPNPDPPPEPFIPNEPINDVIRITPVQFATALIASIIIFMTIAAVYQIFVLGSKMSMKSILKDLYRNLYKVDTSDAYRKAIFKAYKKMCEELANYGHERQENITPKEFEREIRKYLPIDKKHLHTLTKLFEEARYSDHAFNEKKKKRALKALKGIIKSLEEVTTFEEIPEKKRWFGKNT
jgi:hypothetical protein